MSTIQKYVTLGTHTPIFDKGDWETGISYATANIVFDDGVWYCFVPHVATLDNRPGVGAEHAKYWRKWSQKGDKGEKGDPTCWALNEVPSRTNQNGQFVLTRPPSGPILLWCRGLLLMPGKDYSIEGTKIQLSPHLLENGDNLIAAYPH